MPAKISPLSDVDCRARLAEDVEIGPFCVVGPDVKIGNGCRLDNHVTLTGKTTIGEGNRFWPNTVIGGEPQDISFREDADVCVIIGNNNQFREGVTVHRGAEKEDGTTRIGDNNLFMANSHIAHNCVIGNNTYLVNGSLLGGHVHVHDGAIISGNTVVHHFSTLGTLCFISGGCRVPHDVPPYMLAAGSDNPEIKNINVVGMKRKGISNDTIRVIKQAYRLLYREHKTTDKVREILCEGMDIVPWELTNLLSAIDSQKAGRMGRAREAVRNDTPDKDQNSQQDRRAA